MTLPLARTGYMQSEVPDAVGERLAVIVDGIGAAGPEGTASTCSGCSTGWATARARGILRGQFRGLPGWRWAAQRNLIWSTGSWTCCSGRSRTWAAASAGAWRGRCAPLGFLIRYERYGLREAL